MALVGLGIAYLVVFLKLMSRFHKNAALFKGSDLDISRKFFLFSWFIPIVSLYVPFRATDEILSLSQPRTRTEPATDRLLIAYWLSAFVTYLLLSVVIVNSISLGNVGPQFGGGPSL
ncbi:MAG TPA: DUF4328 domain-containing protein, partial [Planctomycetaceae bacterium]|nr:DUF4328 domain-containing protein [Planctomycetaceae bacterium]